MSLEELLDECTTPEPNTGCWLWERATLEHGYGFFKLMNKQTVLAHRHVWELANGRKIPEGMVVRHRCDQPACVWPGHLQIGTQADNSADMVRRGRCRQGAQHQWARLTEESVREIRKLRTEGRLLGDIAALYGVSAGTVSLVALRQTWKHVD